MQQPPKRSASPPTIMPKADKRKSDASTSARPGVRSAHAEGKRPASAGPRKTNVKQLKRGKQKTGIVVNELKPIHRSIPYYAKFIEVGGLSHRSTTTVDRGFLKHITRNVKGIFEGVKTKGLEKEEFMRLRAAVGSLKNAQEPLDAVNGEPEDRVEEKNRPKTKKELLEEKRKALDQQTKSAKKTNSSVGIRIEIDRLRKRFPDDPNLILMNAVLTAKDSCSVHRTIKERIDSLYAALQAAGAVVIGEYVTTYSVEVLFDIYFLYLEALKTRFMGDLKSVNASESDSLRRDIRVLNLLLEQKRLGKTIANVAKKLDGFGYPYESLSPFHVARTFQAENEEGDERIGPGTVKLNKFLIRIYLNAFSQVPAFHPVARKYCDALPGNRPSRAIVANVNVENAIIKFKIAKLNKTRELGKMINSIYNYARSFIGTNFAETVTSPLEAKLLLRIAQMVDEMGLISTTVDPELLTYGYKCATIALHYYKDEAEALLNRISDIAARQQLDLS